MHHFELAATFTRTTTPPSSGSSSWYPRSWSFFNDLSFEMCTCTPPWFAENKALESSNGSSYDPLPICWHGIRFYRAIRFLFGELAFQHGLLPSAILAKGGPKTKSS
mmetsp:Transcript_772/g.1769  ORF Transcript_772/g.1769 Transcript_772/m.1769 type:complete len:107 (-) Transcript_772:513-833(-)